MRKLILATGLIIVVVLAFLIYNKLYYPPLPIDSISKKEVIEKLKNSDGKMVKLINENGQAWYIVNERNNAIANEIIAKQLSKHGWDFMQQEGSALFFEKAGVDLIVSTQKWTGEYLLVNMPSQFDE